MCGCRNMPIFEWQNHVRGRRHVKKLAYIERCRVNPNKLTQGKNPKREKNLPQSQKRSHPTKPSQSSEPPKPSTPAEASSTSSTEWKPPADAKASLECVECDKRFPTVKAQTGHMNGKVHAKRVAMLANMLIEAWTCSVCPDSKPTQFITQRDAHINGKKHQASLWRSSGGKSGAPPRNPPRKRFKSGNHRYTQSREQQRGYQGTSVHYQPSYASHYDPYGASRSYQQQYEYPRQYPSYQAQQQSYDASYDSQPYQQQDTYYQDPQGGSYSSSYSSQYAYDSPPGQVY